MAMTNTVMLTFHQKSKNGDKKHKMTKDKLSYADALRSQAARLG
jgi:hypothetical protein